VHMVRGHVESLPQLLLLLHRLVLRGFPKTPKIWSTGEDDRP
jgi:hypothetical protein